MFYYQTRKICRSASWNRRAYCLLFNTQVALATGSLPLYRSPLPPQRGFGPQVWAAGPNFGPAGSSGPSRTPYFLSLLPLYMGTLTVTLPPPRVTLSVQAAQDPVEHPSGDHAVATGSPTATPIDQSGLEPSGSVGPAEHPVDYRS